MNMYMIYWWNRERLVEDIVPGINQIDAAERFKAKHPNVRWFDYQIKIRDARISFLPKQSESS